MSPKTLYRLLIVGTFVWVLATAFVTAFTLPSLPQPLLNYVMQHAPDRPLYVPRSADKVLMLAITVCVGAVSIATIIGLWCFRRWARILLLVCTAVGFISQIFAGPQVLPGPAWFCFSVSEFLQGLGVAIAFLPPAGDLFAPPRSNQTMELTAARTAFTSSDD